MNWRLCALIVVMVIGVAAGTAPAHAQKKAQPNEKYASLVIDADTGAVLSSRHADAPRYPASLTKMMTLLLVFDALERGDIKLKDRIHVSQNAAAASPSKLGLPAGSSIRVEDAILALVTKSANDMAIAVAEHLGKTESRFALMMTRRAQDLGMTRTTFKNASGLPHAQQITTARDIAKLAQYILHRYPHYYGYFSTRTFTYQGKTHRNHNRLMETYSGMDGFKTGYINASGFNLVASARRDGRRLIGVVFGGRTTATRNAHMADILDAGFRSIGKGGVPRSTTQVAAYVPDVMPPLPKRKPGILVAQHIMQPAPSIAPVAAAAVPPMGMIAPAPDVLPAPQQMAALAPSSSMITASSLSATPPVLTQQQARAMATPADEDNVVRQLVRIQPTLQSGAYDELAGQGDFDPAVTKRLETGLLTAAVHKNRVSPIADAPAGADVNTVMAEVVPVSLPPAQPDNKWAIQIGAFNSRVATDDALRRAQQALPAGLKNAQPLVVPIRGGSGLIFRARLAGYSREEAKSACMYLRDCMTIAPKAQ